MFTTKLNINAASYAKDYYLNAITKKSLYRFRSDASTTSATTSATTVNIVNGTPESTKTKTNANGWETGRPFEEIPKVSLWALIRDVMLPGGKFKTLDRVETVLGLRDIYGDIFRTPSMISTPGLVMTFNPLDFETVFRNEGHWPHRMGMETLGHYRTKIRAEKFHGVEGLLTSQGEAWGKFRSAVNATLMQPKNVKIYLQKMSDVNRDFIEKIRNIRDPKTNELPANFETETNRWALESVCVVALEKRLGLLKSNEPDPRAQQLIQSVTDFIILTEELETKPSPWRFITTPKYKRLIKALDSIHEVTSGFVNEAIVRIEDENKKGIMKSESEKSVLEKLLQVDKNIAIVMANDMLMAGVDTTTTTFTGFLLNMAKHPEKQKKLREELMRVLPNKDSEFTEASLNDMSYLRACIKESLRLYPIADSNGRVVQNDVIISGYQVPKNTFVVVNYSTSLWNEEHYSQPREFIPERWIRSPNDSNDTNQCPVATKSKNPFVYLPFGFGPRSCVGRRIAELELELGAARLIRNFNVEYKYPMEKPFKTTLITVPNIPLKFTLTDVES